MYEKGGDEIYIYTAGVGWHEQESKAETEVYRVLKAACCGVFCVARQEINADTGVLKKKNPRTRALYIV